MEKGKVIPFKEYTEEDIHMSKIVPRVADFKTSKDYLEAMSTYEKEENIGDKVMDSKILKTNEGFLHDGVDFTGVAEKLYSDACRMLDIIDNQGKG